MTRFFSRAVWAVFLILLCAAGVFYWNPLWVNDQQIRYHLWRAHVRSEYVDVAGYRLHYFEAVPPDGSAGIPLVLVHGLGARGEDWSAMIPTLAAQGFHVYVPDLLGYGRSARPDLVCSVPLEEEILAGFMHSVGLSHADLDGWSMGGWIAAKLALDHPAMVDRLVLDDSVCITFRPTFARDSFVPTDSAGLTRLMALLSPHPARFPPFIVRATLRKIASEGKIVQQSMDSMLGGTDLLDARLNQIAKPTLIVWGAEDRLIPIEVGKTMHRDIPGSALVAVPGCGHLAPAECAKPVLAATIAFLKSTPPQ